MVDVTKIKTLFPELTDMVPEDLSALAEYFESVSLLSAKKLNLEFNNKDMNHAAIVMSTIFQTAEKNIKIFAGNFKGNICDKEIYLNSLNSAVSNNKEICVVFEGSPNKDSKCLKMLIDQKSKGKNISIKILSKDFVSKLNKMTDGGVNHFTVADNRMFRYETDMISFKAFCNFDDEKIGTILDNNFTVLQRESIDYPIN